jgi:hypothetical protein
MSVLREEMLPFRGDTLLCIFVMATSYTTPQITLSFSAPYFPYFDTLFGWWQRSHWPLTFEQTFMCINQVKGLPRLWKQSHNQWHHLPQPIPVPRNACFCADLDCQGQAHSRLPESDSLLFIKSVSSPFKCSLAFIYMCFPDKSPSIFLA